MNEFEYFGNVYAVTVYPENNDIITFARNGEYKTVAVHDASEFVYQLKKTVINASGKAEGLKKFICNAFKDGFCECLAIKIIDFAIDEMQEARR